MTQVVGVFFSLLISAPALAAEQAEVQVEALAHRTELAGALSHSTFDPTVVRRGVGGRLIHHVSPVFAFGVEGAYYLNLGESNWTSITRNLIDVRTVSPDFAVVMGHVAGRVEFAPITGTFGRAAKPSTIGLYGLLGFGVVHTQDDLESTTCDNNGPCVIPSTANQVHPSTALGVGLRLQHKRLIGRLELRDVGYIEAYDGVNLGIEHLLLTELSMGLLIGRR
ncbi:MAG: hypothetical protein AB8H79_25705 [Myxococcota bacterium]